MLKAACIQHVPFEGPGYLEKWLSRNHISLKLFPICKELVFPSPDEYDILLIMGGPMSVNDKHISFVREESDFLKAQIPKFKFVMGFCLGAQFIAKSMGMAVYPCTIKEIGWYDVDYIGESFKGLPGRFKSFHWHGETFDIPDQAEHLFQTDEVSNQGFLINNCLAIQFHPEMEEEGIQSIVQHCGDELSEKGLKIQTPSEMTNQPEYVSANNQIIEQLLDQFILKK